MLTSGKVIRAEREKQALSLEDIESKTRIRKDKLQALEESRWDVFPSKTYIIGLIRSYGTFLGLDGDKLVAFFRREYEKTDDIRFKRKVNKYFLSPERKKALIVASVSILSAFTLYFGYQLTQYLSPPELTILSPQETTFVREDFITLKAETSANAMIEINGERVFQNNDNTFSYTFPLTKGANSVFIKITGANGKVATFKKVYEKK